MKRGLVPWGGLSVPVRIARAELTAAEGTLLSEEIWNVCRDAALRLPRSIRVELHTQPGEPRVAADAGAVRREFAALLQRAAALLRSRAGVLVVGVLVTAPELTSAAHSPCAWIAVRLFGDRAEGGDPRALDDDFVGGEVEGPGRSKGGRPFRTERFGPSHLTPPPAPPAHADATWHPSLAVGAARFRLAPPE